MKLFSESITRNWMMGKACYNMNDYTALYRNFLFNTKNKYFMKELLKHV